MAAPESIDLAVRFDRGLQALVSGWIGIDHGLQRRTQDAGRAYNVRW